MERLQNQTLGDKTYGGDDGRSRCSCSCSCSCDSSEELVATEETKFSLGAGVS